MINELIYFYPSGHEAHRFPGHPERPERIEAIRDGLRKEGWWDPYQKINAVKVPTEILSKVHDQSYLDTLQEACTRNQWLDQDTYTTEFSWQLSLQAAGGSIAVCDLVWSGKASKGFSLARPPGHHATRGMGMGFCLLNNIAIAAEYLTQTHQVKRLAILDLDLHHGNGTQNIFYERGDVLFISIHQSPLYPLTGSLDEEGAASGYGTNFNLPLPPGSGDKAYSIAVNKLILPLLDKFSPEMILISFGFDIHWLDPLGSILLSGQGCYEIFSQLNKWSNQNCQGKIVTVLEGGYNLDAASTCSQAVVAALLGKAWNDPIGRSKSPETSTWEKVLNHAKIKWNLQ